MNNSDYRILIVDDEPDILEFLSYNLKKEGYVVSVASNGLEALESAQAEKPHLALLDVMMPGMDGIETCEKLRENQELSSMVIAFLTARSEDYSQIAGFEAGADDYISKPIRPKVLLSRIKALLKRFSSNESTTADTNFFPVKSISINRERYMVIKDGVDISLPRKEFELLALLASKPDRVFSRDEIFETVWGNDIIVGDRTIDVHIRKLREKIGQKHIYTIKGVGYKFVD
ncbi:MAG: DNA-binding response regulator [Bacteroidetes bacterium HGW-Bacteroidetes-21]|nr:MAG: DNA-binding response regulator [Bacteroidetes bacterium HGW-Bacteroidetes-21]